MVAWLTWVTKPAAPAIALLVDSSHRREGLSGFLLGLGYRVVFDPSPQAVTVEQLARVNADLWLLDMPDESPLTDWLLEYSVAPVLVGAGDRPAAQSEQQLRWQRRLLHKLDKFLGPLPQRHELPLTPQPRPSTSVWLLAASLGGPAAVKRFLDTLPTGIPVAFVYAQHIDTRFEHQLPHILGRDNDWSIRNCAEGFQLQQGEVLVAPIAQALRFGAQGQVLLQNEPWPGIYQPAFDALLDEIAAAHSPNCGAIIFSGMGEDGVAACGRLREQGREVWTQSSASAACATMPEAVYEAGYSSREGSPEELAAALYEWLKHECSLNL